MPTVAQGVAPVQTFVSGNTIRARPFTYTTNASAPTITAAYLAVKNSSGVQIYKVACTIAGAVVTRPVIPAETTKTWGVGSLTWDIETTIDGEEKTFIRGVFTALRTDQ